MAVCFEVWQTAVFFNAHISCKVEKNYNFAKVFKIGKDEWIGKKSGYHNYVPYNCNYRGSELCICPNC